MIKKHEETIKHAVLLNIISNESFNSIYINDDEKKFFLENYSSIEIKKGNFNEIALIKKK